MAISTNGGGIGGRRRNRGGGSLSEINVTPFVDVVLVLLIIFMLTAHVMEFGIEVDVPKVKVVKNSAKELPVVSITRQGDIYLNKDPVNINALADTLRQRYRKADTVYVRADKATVWDPIAQVIATLGAAKIGVNVVTQPEDSASRGGR